MSDSPDCTPHLEQETYLNLVRAHDCITGDQHRFFQNFGVTAQQFNVLRVLAGCPDDRGFACQAIAEKLLNRVPDITRLLDRLEQAGLIQRFRCCNDRRVVRTQLTPDGRTKVAEIEAPLRATLAERFAHMTRQEIQELNRLLLKLRSGPCSEALAEEEALGGTHPSAG